MLQIFLCFGKNKRGKSILTKATFLLSLVTFQLKQVKKNLLWVSMLGGWKIKKIQQGRENLFRSRWTNTIVITSSGMELALSPKRWNKIPRSKESAKKVCTCVFHLWYPRKHETKRSPKPDPVGGQPATHLLSNVDFRFQRNSSIFKTSNGVNLVEKGQNLFGHIESNDVPLDHVKLVKWKYENVLDRLHELTSLMDDSQMLCSC